MLNILVDITMYGEVQVFQSFLSKILVHCPKRPLKLIIHSLQNTLSGYLYSSQSLCQSKYDLWSTLAIALMYAI